MLNHGQFFFVCLMVVSCCFAISCNNQPTDHGSIPGNEPPDTFFAPKPLDGSMNNSFKLRLEWRGNDGDGVIKGYEYRVDGPLYDNSWQFTESFFENFKFRNGWYTVDVRAVDNSANVDPTPATLTFHVLGPTFDKGILIIDDTISDQNTESREDAIWDSVMTGAGYNHYTLWDYHERFGTVRPVFVAAANDTDGTGAQSTGLGEFSTIIWYTDPTGNLGLNKGYLQDYLDMGGNLWIAGGNPMESLTGDSPNGSNLPTSGMAYTYFRVLRADMASLNLDWLLSVSEPYPDIATSYHIPNTPISQYVSVQANQLVPLPDARSLYVFNQNYYTDATNRQVNSEKFSGTPCAIVYKGETFKTAMFGFPLINAKRVGPTWVNLVNTQAMTKIVQNILENEFEEPK